MKSVAVTGASGFVGRALVNRLAADGVDVHALLRSTSPVPLHAREHVVGPLETASLHDVLTGRDVIVHSAGRAHVMGADPHALSEFRRANVDATVRLAEQASAVGVRRFVYLSSIKVNGEGSSEGEPIRAGDPPAPSGPYGLSKFEAEQALWRIRDKTGMEIVIVRPVLAYGPGVRANFASLMKWLKRGVPLPLGSVANLRSLVGVRNLCDMLVASARAEGAANRVLLVSDGLDLSTSELIRRLAAALGVRPRLLPVPPAFIEAAGSALGKGGAVRRLLGTLQVDIRPTRDALGWAPPFSVDEELRETARWYLQSLGAESR